MIVLLIIEYVLAICLIIIALVFFTPIIFNIRVSKYDGLALWVKINWLFNAFCCHIEKKKSQKPVTVVKFFGLKIPTGREKAREKKKEKKKSKKEKKFNFRELLNKPFLTKALQFTKKVIKHILPQEFRIKLSYGFDNPADTGMVCGFTALFSAYFSGYDICLDPIFDREILEGEFSLKGRVFCFVLAYYVLQLILSRTFRKTIKEARKIK